MEQKNKKLGLRDNIVLGLSFMAPALSLLATFSLVMVAGYTWAGVPLAYLIAGLVVIVTATSFATLSKNHPGGGSVWAYSKSILGRRLGQLPAWVYMLEILVVPAACLIPVGFFVQDWIGLPPWLTVLIGFTLVTILAGTGAELSFKTMAVLFGVQVLILLIFAVSAIVWSSGAGTFSGMATTALRPSGSLMGWAGIIVGAAAAVFSYMGFESSASMSAETKEPTKTIPKAILLTAVIGTILNTFLAWAFVLAIPSKGLFSLLYYVNPVPAMAGVIWQDIPPFHEGWRHLINLAGTVAGLTGALAGITSGSRIMEQLGKDEVLPQKFGAVTKGRGVPLFAIGFAGAVGVLLAEFIPWETVAYLIATGAVPTFFLVNFMVFWENRKARLNPHGVLRHWVLPWLGMILCAWIAIVGLPTRMKMILLLWVTAGFVVIYLRDAVSREKKPWLGVVLSLLALAVSVAVVAIWTIYYGGSLTWWHMKAPYAQGNPLAMVLAVALAAAFLVLAVWFTQRSGKEASPDEKVTA